MHLTRRTAATMIGSLALLPARAPAATPVRFSYQRSSTLLTLLKADATLEAPFAAKGYVPAWNLFDNIIVPMNAGTALCGRVHTPQDDATRTMLGRLALG